MKILFIGGTGFISTSVSRLAVAKGFQLFLLNRGQRKAELAGVHRLTADAHQPDQVRAALGKLEFDAVVDWIAYTPEDIERDLALFRGRTRQFIFISSASAYQKPPSHHVIRESTPLHNPFWLYETIADALGMKANLVHIPSDFIARVAPEQEGPLLGDKTWSVIFDNSKIKSFVPGFQAVIPFREGIRRTLAWFDADKKRRRVDPAANAQLESILAAYGAASAKH